MIAVDTNVLVLAARESGGVGDAVRARISARRAELRIPVFCIGEFWRVVTHPQAPVRMPPGAAFRFLETIAPSQERLLLPGRRYWRVLRDLIAQNLPRSSEVFDHQILAVCLERGCKEIWTFDGKFPQIGGLVAVNRLA
jgi:predicted nucleic acid-binding protein